MRWTAIRGAFACIALMVAPVGAIGAQAHATRALINGEWEGTLALEGGTHPLSIVFEITDSAFAGKVFDGGQLFGQMKRGTMSGDTVRFYIDKLFFTGVIAGSKMKIALVMYNGTTRNFVASRRPGDKPRQ
jgi:hypothetical protein